MLMSTFAPCTGCPAPVSCDIRSACDRAQASPEVALLLGEILDLKNRVRNLQEELANANGALIASREEARLMRLAADRMEAAQAYATTKRFHEQQSHSGIGRIWSGGKLIYDDTSSTSLLVADLEVTEEEDEAFAELAKRIVRLENAFSLQQGRINTLGDRLDAAKEAL